MTLTPRDRTDDQDGGGVAPLRPLVSLRLTSDFDLVVDGISVRLPHGLERVVAYLALAHGRVPRSALAGALWLDTAEQRAMGNLRTALWRLHRVDCPIVNLRADRVGLDVGVRVDVDELIDLASSLIAGTDRGSLDRLPELIGGYEILPTWGDEWLLAERQRYRMLRLHALEAAGAVLLAAGEFGRAMEAALAAVEADPFRESAWRLAIEVDIREGNMIEAVRQYAEFRRLVSAELGIDPSPRMEALVGPLLADHRH